MVYPVTASSQVVVSYILCQYVLVVFEGSTFVFATCFLFNVLLSSLASSSWMDSCSTAPTLLIQLVGQDGGLTLTVFTLLL